MFLLFFNQDNAQNYLQKLPVEEEGEWGWQWFWSDWLRKRRATMHAEQNVGSLVSCQQRHSSKDCSNQMICNLESEAQKSADSAGWHLMCHKNCQTSMNKSGTCPMGSNSCGARKNPLTILLCKSSAKFCDKTITWFITWLVVRTAWRTSDKFVIEIIWSVLWQNNRSTNLLQDLQHDCSLGFVLVASAQSQNSTSEMDGRIKWTNQNPLMKSVMKSFDILSWDCSDVLDD